MHFLTSYISIALHYFLTSYISIGGSKGGAVVRALTSYQCGPGSNPGVYAICGMSLLLVLSLAPRGFSLSLKTNTFKFQFDLERTDTFQRVLMNSLVLRG